MKSNSSPLNFLLVLVVVIYAVYAYSKFNRFNIPTPGPTPMPPRVVTPQPYRAPNPTLNRVTLSGPSTAMAWELKSYTIKLDKPTSSGTSLAVFTAPVIDTSLGYHQDSWTLQDQALVYPAKPTHLSSILFPTPGKYWVMVNLNNTSSQDCTGNPTYTESELRDINITSCGDTSFLVVNVIDTTQKL